MLRGNVVEIETVEALKEAIDRGAYLLTENERNTGNRYMESGDEESLVEFHAAVARHWEHFRMDFLRALRLTTHPKAELIWELSLYHSACRLNDWCDNRSLERLLKWGQVFASVAL